MVKATKNASGSWSCRAYYKDENGNIHRPVFTASKKSEAEKQATIFLANAKEEVKKRKDNLYNITFKEAAERYIASRETVVSPATTREYIRALNGYYYERINDKLLFDITAEDVQLMVNDWAKRLSPKTIRDKHGFVSAVIGTYRKDRFLDTTLPEPENIQLYTPEDKEVQQLINYVRGTKLEAPVIISAFASLRRSEMCALTLKDIGPDYISVDKAIVLDKDNKWVQKRTKTQKGTRVIPIPVDVSRRLREIAYGDKIVAMTPNQLSAQFAYMLKKTGLTHFRLHALRSYYASVMHALKIPDQYIMQWGGWKDQKTMQKHYQKPLDEYARAMAQVGISHFESML